jgi:hypothetical protein
MKITVQQAVDMHNSIEAFKKSDVSLPIVRLVDLATNKQSIASIVSTVNDFNELSEEYKKYLQELEEIKLEGSDSNGNCLDPARFVDKIRALKTKHLDAITAQRKKMEELKAFLVSEREVDLIKIPKAELKAKGDTASDANLIFGLLPILS